MTRPIITSATAFLETIRTFCYSRKQKDEGKRINENLTKEELLECWLSASDKFKYFFTSTSNQSESETPSWTMLSGDTGFTTMQDIKCCFPYKREGLTIGYLQSIQKNKEGVVTIGHFALNPDLTKQGVGKIFLETTIAFFKQHKCAAIKICRHDINKESEKMKRKLEHYRAFFKKHGIKEVRERVWRISL